jgi:P27 family predicted phage terminase small subunit
MKPTALKVLEGNRGRRPLPANEPVYELADIEPPATLSEASKAEWLRLAPMLTAQRVLTEADLAIFGHYVEAVGHLNELKEIERQAALDDARFMGKFVVGENGSISQAPWFVAQRQWSAVLIKSACELGLTPSSRTRVQSTPEPAEGEIDMAKKYGF